MSVPAYHLDELRIALDATHTGNMLPPRRAPGDRVLDIGCGAGQTLIAAYPDRLSYGIDVDFDAVQLGRTLTERVAFACGRAERLPYATASFDLVVARVSLPYTNLPSSLAEIRRVLRPSGELWMTLHPLWIPWRNARKSRSVRASIFFAYTVLNGVLFHFWQWQFPFRGRFESFQTERGMRRCLERNGFEVSSVSHERGLLVIARAIQR